MNISQPQDDGMAKPVDRLEAYGIYRLPRQLFDYFWNDAEIPARNIRGCELGGQQVRSLDSSRAKIEEGFGRGFGKEWPQHLKTARGEARESLGRYQRCHRLLPAALIMECVAALNHIIGGLTKTIQTVESRPTSPSRHPSPVTRYTR
jgi:four helix bundle protein